MSIYYGRGLNSSTARPYVAVGSASSRVGSCPVAAVWSCSHEFLFTSDETGDDPGTSGVPFRLPPRRAYILRGLTIVDGASGCAGGSSTFNLGEFCTRGDAVQPLRRCPPPDRMICVPSFRRRPRTTWKVTPSEGCFLASTLAFRWALLPLRWCASAVPRWRMPVHQADLGVSYQAKTKAACPRWAHRGGGW